MYFYNLVKEIIKLIKKYLKNIISFFKKINLLGRLSFFSLSLEKYFSSLQSQNFYFFKI